MARFDKLPGIDGENTTRRNVVVSAIYLLFACVTLGGMYLLAGYVAIGAVASNSDDGSDDTDSTATHTPGDVDTPTPGGATSLEDTTAPGDDQTTEPGTSPPEDPETPTPAGSPTAGELGAVSENMSWLTDQVTLTGNGQSVTDTFQASQFTTFVFEHSGDTNFIVKLIDDATGDTRALLINETGQVSGAVGIGLPDGEYSLDVNTNGDWSIEVGEPFAPEGERGVPPASIEGEGMDVYGEVEIDDRVTFSAQHDGDSNFIVKIWDEMNSRPSPNEIVFNEIGQFEGERSVQLSGSCYISVDAGGSYSIDIS